MTTKQIESWLQHGRGVRRIVIEAEENRFVAIPQVRKYKQWIPLHVYNTGTTITSALHLLDLED